MIREIHAGSISGFQKNDSPVLALKAQSVSLSCEKHGQGAVRCFEFDGGPAFVSFHGQFIFPFLSPLSDDDLCELSQFLFMTGFAAAESAGKNGRKLSRILAKSINQSKPEKLMSGEFFPSGNNISFKHAEKITKNENLSGSAKLISESFAELSEPVVFADISARVQSGFVNCFLFEDGQGPAASVTVSGRFRSDEMRSDFFMSGFCVRSDLRGKGLGTAFLSAVLNGIPGRVLVMHKKELKTFYQKMGFKKTEPVWSV